MAKVICSKCGKQISGSDVSRALARHLRTTHALTDQGEILTCGQNGCRQTFRLMNSYLRHIRRQHLNASLTLPVPPDQCNPNNDNPGQSEAPSNSDDDSQNSDSEQDEEIPPEQENCSEDFSVDLLKQIAIGMIMKLKSTASVPYSAVKNVIRSTKVMFQDTLTSLKDKMLQVMAAHDVDAMSPDVKNLCSEFSSYENPYLGIETPNQQMDYMLDKLMLVPPVEIALGSRLDEVYDNVVEDMVSKHVTETFQYVPVIEVLKLILKPGVERAINKETKSTAGYLKSYRDGQQYQQHGIFKNYPNALRLQLFYDDVEVVNPLGSKAGIHKLGLFYYTIQNLPFHATSSMNSVFLLAACCTSDIKRYGFKPILDPFIKEVKQLESDSGVLLQWNDRQSVVHGTLVSFSADSLAAHELLGFLSPSATMLCRLCKATRESIQVHFEEDDFEMRGIDDHDDSVSAATCRSHGDPLTGVRTSCHLDQLQNFHCVKNFNLDIMHDMLEGVCPYEAKLLLFQFIFIDKFFTLTELNQRIKSFHYSLDDRKNKPTTLQYERLRRPSDHKLGQKAAQMWCLIRMLPFLIGDFIPEGNTHYNLLLLLLRCMDIIYAPLVTLSQTVYLKHLIAEHHTHFKELFPDKQMINKHHHMVHYPTCIRMSGPLVTMQCMKYEMKHGFSKRVASVNCNFRNICKSVACKHQILQCTSWSIDNQRMCPECSGGTTMAVHTLEEAEIVEEVLQVDGNVDVFVTSEVTVLGTCYKTKQFVASGIENDEAQFHQILNIIMHGDSIDDVYFVAKKYKTIGYNEHFHSYEVQAADGQDIIRQQDLIDHRPLTRLLSYRANSPIFLSPRYCLTQINN